MILIAHWTGRDRLKQVEDNDEGNGFSADSSGVGRDDAQEILFSLSPTRSEVLIASEIVGKAR